MVKRDMEIARDEVRVMTVHGAKGLEAPVVILADTTTPPAGPPGAGAAAGACRSRASRRHAVRHRLGRPQGRRRRGGRRGARRGAAEAEDEHRRLLYVAMTRAAERLIVCGWQGVNRRPKGCWYDLVTDGLAASPDFEEVGEGEARIGRYRIVPHQDDVLGETPPPRAARRMTFPPGSLCRSRPSRFAR